MDLTEWVLELEPIEAAYVRQCYRYWNGTNGGIEPEIPPGLSKARADILRYHVKSLNNGQRGKRKMDQAKPVSFRWSEKFKRELAFEASLLDVSLSEYVYRAINIGRPIVLAYPKRSKAFPDPVLEIHNYNRSKE